MKKPYTPPTITEHGDIVKNTTGIGGKYWEFACNKAYYNGEEDPIKPENQA